MTLDETTTGEQIARIDAAIELELRPEGAEGDEWLPSDAGSFDWAMRKMTGIGLQIGKLEKARNERLEEIARQYEKATGPLGDRWNRMKDKIAAGLVRNVEPDSKGHLSIKVGAGTAFFKAPGTLLSLPKDRGELITWAKAEGVEIKSEVKESITAETISDHFKETGELPPGCEIKPKEFVVKCR